MKNKTNKGKQYNKTKNKYKKRKNLKKKKSINTSKRIKRTKNFKKNNRKKSLKKMKGGAIPFSELGLVYDNMKYGITGFFKPIIDNPQVVPNNTPYNVNPNPTSQFVQASDYGETVTNPKLTNIFKAYYNPEEMTTDVPTEAPDTSAPGTSDT